MAVGTRKDERSMVWHDEANMGGKPGDYVSARRMQNAYRASWADLSGARPVTAHRGAAHPLRNCMHKHVPPFPKRKTSCTKCTFVAMVYLHQVS